MYCKWVRQQKVCRHATEIEITYKICDLCLKGMQIESIELLTSTIMENGIDRLERLV